MYAKSRDFNIRFIKAERLLSLHMIALFQIALEQGKNNILYMGNRKFVEFDELKLAVPAIQFQLKVRTFI